MRRVEAVEETRFTQVMHTGRGRPVRVDFEIARRDAPAALAWRQQIEGTPFARVLESSLITLELTAAGEATTVTVTQAQKLRGSSRGGGVMLRRATGRRLTEALAGLAALCESGEEAARGR